MGIELLTERYKSRIADTLSCYDGIIIQGTLPKRRHAQGMTEVFYTHFFPENPGCQRLRHLRGVA